jgi:hypothetical protein
MGRGKSGFTQSALCRIFKAAHKSGVVVRVTLPDGTIIETADKNRLTAANDNIPAAETNDFEDLLNGENPAQVRK